ncbi:MAG: YihA family ribosome biogenesis GTP-binding protein [Lachnospiraceae bacterium]|nr:YihA family ribosome biogenesis GTP-binding protein [Lachnospiraceae bacterium]
MIIKSAELETVCGITSTLPVNDLPEVAFTGKSNVGKSSLINSVMNRKSLARTSAQPGKTQTINFYNINNEIYLVDLPGYGYAKTSKAEREAWGEMIENYLTGSEMLSAVFLLIDIRHDPTEQDMQMFDWLNYLEIETVVLCTKADKLSNTEVDKSLRNIRKKLKADEDTIIIPFSSVTKEGRETVWDLLDQIKEWEEE